MFRGTKKYPKEAYSEALKMTGASANANTSLDRTVYHMTGDASKLEKMFELEADRFMNLSYSEQDFRTEAGAVKASTQELLQPLATRLNEKLQGDRIRPAHLQAYHHGFPEGTSWICPISSPIPPVLSTLLPTRIHHHPGRGRCNAGRCRSAVAALLRYLARGTHVNKIPSEPAQKGTRYAHIQKSGSHRTST